MSTLRFLQQENARLQSENATLRDENRALRGYVNALDELHWATQEIISEENLFTLLDKILNSAMHVTEAEDGSLLLLDEDTNELVFVLVHGDLEQSLRGHRIPSDGGIAGWVTSNNQPLIVNNPRQDKRFSSETDELFDFSTRTIVCVPMTNRGKMIGVIELINKRDNEQFSDADTTLLSILGQVAATALIEMEMQSRLDAGAEEVKL